MRVMKIDVARTRMQNIDSAIRQAMRSDYDCIWFYGFPEDVIREQRRKVMGSGIGIHTGNRPPPVPSTFKAKQQIDEVNLL